MKKLLALLFLASFAFMGCPEAGSDEKAPTESAVHSHEDGSSHGGHSHGDGADHQHPADADGQEEFTVEKEAQEHAGHSHEDQSKHDNDGHEH